MALSPELWHFPSLLRKGSTALVLNGRQISHPHTRRLFFFFLWPTSPSLTKLTSEAFARFLYVIFPVCIIFHFLCSLTKPYPPARRTLKGLEFEFLASFVCVKVPAMANCNSTSYKVSPLLLPPPAPLVSLVLPEGRDTQWGQGCGMEADSSLKTSQDVHLPVLLRIPQRCKQLPASISIDFLLDFVFHFLIERI